MLITCSTFLVQSGEVTFWGQKKFTQFITGLTGLLPDEPGPGSLGVARRDHDSEGHDCLEDRGGHDPRTASNRRRNFVITAVGRWRDVPRPGGCAARDPWTGGDVSTTFCYELPRGSSPSHYVKALIGQPGGTERWID